MSGTDDGRLPIPEGLGRLGLGTAGIGNLFTAISDEQAYDTVDAAWAGGIRAFDTAPTTGWGSPNDVSGAALARYPRQDFLLSTKVGRLLARRRRTPTATTTRASRCRRRPVAPGIPARPGSGGR